jgi:hypothetical protein
MEIRCHWPTEIVAPRFRILHPAEESGVPTTISIGISIFRSQVWLSVRPTPLRTPPTGTFWRSRPDSCRCRIHLQHGAPGRNRHLQFRLDSLQHVCNRVHGPGIHLQRVQDRFECPLCLFHRNNGCLPDHVLPHRLLHREQRRIAQLRGRGIKHGCLRLRGRPLRRILSVQESLQPAQLKTGGVPPFPVSSEGARDGDSGVHGPTVILVPLRVAP